MPTLSVFRMQFRRAPIFLGWEYENLIGNAIMKFPKQHEFIMKLRDLAQAAGSDVDWGATGPTLITQLAKKHGILDLVSPQPLAYPVQSIDALQLLMPSHRDEVNDRIKNRPFLLLFGTRC